MITFIDFLLPLTFPSAIGAMLAHIGWAIMEGEREAYYYTRIDDPKLLPLPNAHSLFTWQRIGVWMIMLMSCGPVIVLTAMLTFPFLHDGYYYSGRNTWNPEVYTDGFTSEPSDTSTALMNFSYRTRTWMFIAGLVLWVCTTWYAYAH
jgi:hypothetical protein